MKRSALQNKQVRVLGMDFRARKVFRSFEKRTPGLLSHYSLSSENKTKQNKTKMFEEHTHSSLFLLSPNAGDNVYLLS